LTSLVHWSEFQGHGGVVSNITQNTGILYTIKTYLWEEMYS